MDEERREELGTRLLTRLMQADAAIWKRRLLFDDQSSGPPTVSLYDGLDPEERQRLRTLRHVRHRKRA
jgi:hypothetical protein